MNEQGKFQQPYFIHLCPKETPFDTLLSEDTMNRIELNFFIL